MTTLPESIRITEVGPRDGLQNERGIVSVEDKVTFINLLSSSGVAEIETSSFVSPKWVPQLADAAEVFAGIDKNEDVIYSALVPNETGMERALTCGVDKIAVFTAASETFSQKNTRATIDETIDRFMPVVSRAKDNGLVVRGYISCVVACPYEGSISPMQVRDVASKLLDLGVDEIDLGETIGIAAPTDIDRLYEGLSDLLIPSHTTLHLHDTRGGALACAYRAIQLGVRSFDVSCGGLGGCPYAPGAAGNLPSEDLIYMCNQMGIKTGVNLYALYKASRYVATALNRSLTSRVFNADGRSESSSDGSS